jgi:hypothetical protein
LRKVGREEKKGRKSKCRIELENLQRRGREKVDEKQRKGGGEPGGDPHSAEQLLRQLVWRLTL